VAFLEGDDEVAGKDDSVDVFRGVGQPGVVACEEVADAQL
jgi:hypothetical protein